MKRFLVAGTVALFPLVTAAQQPPAPTLSQILDSGQAQISTTVANWRSTIEQQAAAVGQLRQNAAGEPERTKTAVDAAIAKQKADDEKMEAKAVADAVAKQKADDAALKAVSGNHKQP